MTRRDRPAVALTAQVQDPTRIHETLRSRVREASEHDPEPSAASLETQPVTTTEVGGIKGFDAGKKVKGRKRHLVVDTLGWVMAVVVTSAGVQDYHEARPVLATIRGRCPRLKVVWADAIDEKQSTTVAETRRLEGSGTSLTHSSPC